MNMNDKAEMNGYLSIYKKYNDGSLETVCEEEKNIITYKARREHLKVLFDHDNAPKDELASFQVGIGGAVGIDGQGNNNVRVSPPDPTRNNLYHALGITNDAIIITPSPEELHEVYLQITFTLSPEEANGYLINECGLFKESGDMFNHKTFVNIEKTEAFSLIFDWKIRYS